MRLRKVKNANAILEKSPYVIRFAEVENAFKTKMPIYLEIGCGKGEFLINHAIKNPNVNFIGIEKYDSVLVKALIKINEKPKNLKFVHGDAEIIDQMFKNNVSVLFLNFSDPWPKKRHENRRLTSKHFLEKYENIFINKKTIIMKTDNRDLFNFTLEEMQNFGYKIVSKSYDLHGLDITDNVMTEYEKRFVKMNINICYGLFEKE